MTLREFPSFALCLSLSIPVSLCVFVSDFVCLSRYFVFLFMPMCLTVQSKH